MRKSVVPALFAMFFASGVHVLADDGRVTRSAADCAKLATLTLPDARITATKAFAGGDDHNGPVRVPHCKVSGVIGTEIHFEVLLPDEWNQRFVMGGGGGFVGGVDNQVRGVVNAGFASAGTDTGHDSGGTQASWALRNRERQINYGHVGIHRTGEIAQQVIKAYYGAAPTYSYFMGCSNGGRQALMEAQRYPEDFQGIVSGAPAIDITNIVASFIKNTQAALPDPKSIAQSSIRPETLTLVARAALDKCDALDGVRDNVIDDPRACRFDVASLPGCSGDAAVSGCVTKAERDALARIYEPTRIAGTEVYPGQPVGGEADEGGWRAWMTGVDEGMSREAAARCRAWNMPSAQSSGSTSCTPIRRGTTPRTIWHRGLAIRRSSPPFSTPRTPTCHGSRRAAASCCCGMAGRIRR
jgi:feruloyl esterase